MDFIPNMDGSGNISGGGGNRSEQRKALMEQLIQAVFDKSNGEEDSSSSSGMDMNPMDIAQKFMNGGEGGGLGGLEMGSTGSQSITGADGIFPEMMAGGGGEAAGGSGGGGMAGMAGAAWPVAIVAAAIANESYAKDRGYRSDDDGQYFKDLLTSKVGNQDVEQRWAPQLGMKEGSFGNEALSWLSNPLGKILNWV